MTVVENKWLQGPYAPIAGDVTATELTVEGTRHFVGATVVRTPFFNPARKTATPPPQ